MLRIIIFAVLTKPGMQNYSQQAACPGHIAPKVHKQSSRAARWRRVEPPNFSRLMFHYQKAICLTGDRAKPNRVLKTHLFARERPETDGSGEFLNLARHAVLDHFRAFG